MGDGIKPKTRESQQVKLQAYHQQGRTYSMNRRSWSAGISSTYRHAASAALIS